MKKIFILLIFILNFEILHAENKIAYINLDHILNNSIAGNSISNYIQEIEEKKKNEFKLIEKQLSDKEKHIIKKKNIVDKSEFENQVNILKKEIDKYRNSKKKFQEEINKKKIEYTKIILNTLNPIIAKYVEENSISIVFPKKNIIIAKKNLDITKPVIDLLNNKLNKIDF